MKKRNKLRRTLIILLTSLLGMVILVIAFISPITKYVVEKYSVKYTGRQIKMDWAYVNPFTGYVHFSNFKVYEQNSDSLFITISGLSVVFNLYKVLSKNYEISSIRLDKPWVMLVQKKNRFNFQDIIDHFKPNKDIPTVEVNKGPLHFNILNIKIHDGEFHYEENEIGVNYFIKSVNIESPGKWWNSDTMNYKFAFQSGPGSGGVEGSCLANLRNADYHLSIALKDFDLKVFEQYLHEFSNYGKFTANLNANLDATGNFTNALQLKAKGKLALNNFHIGKYVGEDYASFNKFSVNILELSPKNSRYCFDSLTLDSPYLLYEQYDHLNNYEKMFGASGSNITPVVADPAKNNVLVEIAHYIAILATEFFQSDFKINNIGINNGNITYNDYSLREKFSAQIDKLNITADSIYKSHKRVNLLLKSNIKPYGSMVANLSMNPKDYGDFDLTYHMENIPVALFNPYTITYTSFPFDRGSIKFDAVWHVRNGNIQSKNHLIIVDPYTSKRIRKEDTKWIPVPLIMAFIRERGNVIDYEIPITGDLKSPKYHLRYVLLDLLNNIFVKPPTIPYGVKVSNLEKEINKSLLVNWNSRDSRLNGTQEKFIEKIADFLKSNTAASISVTPMVYADKEKEYILFFEAKKKYYLITQHKAANTFTQADSIKVDKMSNKDSLFVKYLNKHIADSMMFTVQEKCTSFIGKKRVDEEYDKLVKDRQTYFLSYFKKEGVADRVKMNAVEESIPFNGFSFYQINYNGAMPDELRKAYMKMNEINDGSLRRKYKALRKNELVDTDK